MRLLRIGNPKRGIDVYRDNYCFGRTNPTRSTLNWIPRRLILAPVLDCCSSHCQATRYPPSALRALAKVAKILRAVEIPRAASLLMFNLHHGSSTLHRPSLTKEAHIAELAATPVVGSISTWQTVHRHYVDEDETVGAALWSVKPLRRLFSSCPYSVHLLCHGYFLQIQI
ncbi:hypothetical protein PIB30_050864 [Stylosanthes scabra]|uniref:Uncharacterized protein n=1 Tax=Stylosanthes scabra TaxID=79078 RepID=A0ABU6RHT0_9FABA|nr:hypothetical protein [Stylosanthes scabra]